MADAIFVRPGVAIATDELQWRTSRSGGPGGQHVNKTESKVTVTWNLLTSPSISEADRRWLQSRLAARLTKAGEVVVSCEEHRDQGRNRADALGKFVELLATALQRPKKRIPTRKTRGSQERRLAAKRTRSGHKQGRRGGFDAE